MKEVGSKYIYIYIHIYIYTYVCICIYISGCLHEEGKSPSNLDGAICIIVNLDSRGNE